MSAASSSDEAPSSGDARATPANLARLSAAVETLLSCLGEDPAREGLAKTPARVAKALLALTAGYAQNAGDIVGDALFDAPAPLQPAAPGAPGAPAARAEPEMVLVRDIALNSLCEHHLLPFFGVLHVAYLPRGKVVGLSKLARITDAFAKRLQIQERLTQQVAAAVHEAVGARGVAVCVECRHMCMAMRGVCKPDAVTATFAYTGDFAADRGLRLEFFGALRRDPAFADAGAAAADCAGALGER